MTAATAQPALSLAQAFEHAERLLEVDPRLAAEQARAILEAVPRHADTTRLLAAALRLSGDPQGGHDTVAPLAAALPNLPLAQLDHVYVRGLTPLGLHVPKGRIWWRMSDHLPLIAEFRL